MFIIPAIDLIQGKCVRLTNGDFNQKTEYHDDPLEVAFELKKAGAKRIHIVDLDGASTGISVNRQIITRIKKETGLIVQTGGGLRTEKDIKELVGSGIDYLVLGTILVASLQLVQSWITKYGSIFLASIDVKENKIQSRGWIKNEGIDAFSFGKQIFESGINSAIYTDISRDGTLKGPNIDGAKEFINKTNLNIILSGGISDANDLKKSIKVINKNLTGIIIGKAYYEGKIDLPQVIKDFQD